jgi:hypothetical protein
LLAIIGPPLLVGVGVGKGGTCPNSVEDDVASVEFELRRDDCCEDEEKLVLDCDGIGLLRGVAKEGRRLLLPMEAEASALLLLLLCED